VGQPAPITLPSLLGQAGYHTAVYADFVGDIFTRFPFGFAQTHAPELNFRVLIEQALVGSATHLLPYTENALAYAWLPVLRARADAPIASRLVDECLAGMVEHASEPTFSALFFSNSHFPYAATYPAYLRARNTRYAGRHRFGVQAAELLAKGPTSQGDALQIQALYDAALWEVDQALADLVAGLSARGLASRTWLVVTADHGENLGEADLGFAHGNHLFGGPSLRVPTAFVDLGRAAAAVRPQQVSSLDLAPTILARLGQTPPTAFVGRDLLGPGADREDHAVLLETGLWFLADSDELHQSLRLPYPSIDEITRVDAAHDDVIELDPRFEPLVMRAKHLALQRGHERLIYMPTRAGPVWFYCVLTEDANCRRDRSRDLPVDFASLRSAFLTELGRFGLVSEKNGWLTWQ
jgi:hypothetical protein